MDLGAFLDAITPGTWPDWVGALGTSAAFLVAAFAYAGDVRRRRWAQARLVYVRLEYLTSHETSATVPILDRGVRPRGTDVEGVELPTRGGRGKLIVDAAAAVTAAIHNGSDELIGPAIVRAVGRTLPGVPWDFEVSAGSVDPHSEVLADLLCSNPHHPGAPPNLELEVTFRDSAGRWWRRRGTEPVERARDRERAARRLGSDKLGA